MSARAEEARKIFDKPDTAKLKNDRTLKDAGDFLQSNRFGVVVVAAYTDMKGTASRTACSPKRVRWY